MKTRNIIVFILMLCLLFPATEVFAQSRRKARRVPKEDRIERLYLPAFEIVDSSKFDTERIPSHMSYAESVKYTTDDIRFGLKRKRSSSQMLIGYYWGTGEYLGHVVRDDTGKIIDTLVTGAYHYDGMGKITHSDIEPISMSEYIAGEHAKFTDKLKKLYDDAVYHLNYLHEQYADSLARARREFVQDSIDKERAAYYARLNAEQERQWKEDERNARIASITPDFHQPDSPIKTKSFTNSYGAKITYSYYMKDGEEVKHGKYSAKHNYNDYRWWSGWGEGWIYLNGYESFECEYRNGVMHGNWHYSRNLTKNSTFGNDRNWKLDIRVNLYCGRLDGNFNIQNESFIYKGSASKGILSEMTITKFDNSHSITVRSNPDGDRTDLKILVIHDDELHNAVLYGELPFIRITCPVTAPKIPYIIP